MEHTHKRRPGWYSLGLNLRERHKIALAHLLRERRWTLRAYLEAAIERDTAAAGRDLDHLEPLPPLPTGKSWANTENEG